MFFNNKSLSESALQSFGHGSCRRVHAAAWRDRRDDFYGAMGYAALCAFVSCAIAKARIASAPRENCRRFKVASLLLLLRYCGMDCAVLRSRFVSLVL